VINCDEDKVSFEALPEFIREPYPTGKEKNISTASPADIQPSIKHGPSIAERMAEYMSDHQTKHPNKRTATLDDGSEMEITRELEALWPGVNNEFFQTTKRTPNFYLTLGFVAGTIVTLFAVNIYAALTHAGNPTQAQDAKRIVVATTGSADNAASNVSSFSASKLPAIAMPSANDKTSVATGNGSELLTPVESIHEVKNGDTMAAIVMHAYKRVSPRLMDTICKANGMRSPDKLTLGQKLSLPPYRTLPTQIAGTGRIQ
jgi:nucleoid-associated protein YgaU